VMLIRRIRELLYEQGFTISGARNRLLSDAQAGEAVSQAKTEPAITYAEIKRSLKEILDLLSL